MTNNPRGEAGSRRGTFATSVALFLLTVLSRIPFRAQILYHWDSVNFAFAMRRFDVALDQPQPPGYILYVWLCRLVDLLFRDANATMVWISVVAGGPAVVFLYLLGRAMWGKRVGLIGALFLAASPLFWFYGEIALPHALDTMMVLLAAWLLWRIRQGERRFLWPAVIVLGVAGGIRPQTLVFLLPLALYAMARAGVARLVGATTLGAVVCLAWLVPLTVGAGGIGRYLEVMSAYSGRFQQTTSVLMGAGWSGVLYNLRKLTLYILYGLAAFLLPCFLAFLLLLPRRLRRRSPNPRRLFLFLWALPPLAFYTLIHTGQQGLVFFFLPVLLLAGAVGLVRQVRGRWLWAATGLLILLNVALFGLAPERPLGPEGPRLLTRDTLVNSDRYYLDRLTVIRESFPPSHTAVVAMNWHHLEYYLPEYVLLRLDPGPPNSPPVLTPRRWPGEGTLSAADLELTPDEERRIALVLFDERIPSLFSVRGPTEATPLSAGGRLQVLWLRAEEWLRYDETGMEVVTP